MDKAIYCVNGHYVAADTSSRYASETWPPYQDSFYADEREPEAPRHDYCNECGQPTMRSCLKCATPILLTNDRPAYCGGCGAAFPWTESALIAAREYTDEIDALNDTEKASLKGTFADLTTETVRTPVATLRFRKYIDKLAVVAPEVGKGLLKVGLDLMKDEVKKKYLGL